MFSSFKQQTGQWQKAFSRHQSGGFFQRLLAWLALGMMLVAGAAILVFMLLLSWILIPILLFRHRAKLKAWQQRYNQFAQQQAAQQRYRTNDAAGNDHHTPASVIEGEVVRKKEE